MEQGEEQHLKGGLGAEAELVRPPQTTVLLAHWAVVEPGLACTCVLALPCWPRAAPPRRRGR